MCIHNKHNPASLQLGKVYRAMRDAKGEKHGYIRVIDEDAEGYLYPKRHFIEVAAQAPTANGSQGSRLIQPVLLGTKRSIGQGNEISARSGAGGDPPARPARPANRRA